ncbi:hypothetical protein BJY01DRAFT_256126 [Aspergillus pseudoustus]|uniref:Uncharacterized protein n=1 Tax=Aspergillus pseudoustus TaxID=1810923 RepID=A0ABR4IE52_9EURO
MSLHRTFLHLSLTSAALGGDQGLPDNPSGTSNIDTLPSYSRNLVTKPFSYGGNYPSTDLSPSLDDTRFLSSDYCFVHDGSTRCCPESLACFSIAGDIYYSQTVYWYEEVHVHYVDVDDDGGEGEEVAVVTEWEVSSSAVQIATKVTVTASYLAEGRGEFARLSWGIVREAETRVVLDEVPTRMRVVTRGIRRTSGAEGSGLLGGLGDGDRQVVLG